MDYTGLSDVYEFIYFNGSADPLADAVADGVSNYDEMIWGADPTDPNFKVTGPTATLNGARVRIVLEEQSQFAQVQIGLHEAGVVKDGHEHLAGAVATEAGTRESG